MISNLTLFFFRNLAHIWARTVSHRRSSWTMKHAYVIFSSHSHRPSRHSSPDIRLLAYFNSFILHMIFYLWKWVQKGHRGRNKQSRYPPHLIQFRCRCQLSLSIKTAVTFWFSCVFKTSILLSAKFAWLYLYFPFFSHGDVELLDSRSL